MGGDIKWIVLILSFEYFITSYFQYQGGCEIFYQFIWYIKFSEYQFLVSQDLISLPFFIVFSSLAFLGAPKHLHLRILEVLRFILVQTIDLYKLFVRIIFFFVCQSVFFVTSISVKTLLLILILLKIMFRMLIKQ